MPEAIFWGIATPSEIKVMFDGGKLIVQKHLALWNIECDEIDEIFTFNENYCQPQFRLRLNNNQLNNELKSQDRRNYIGVIITSPSSFPRVFVSVFDPRLGSDLSEIWVAETDTDPVPAWAAWIHSVILSLPPPLSVF